MMKINKRLLSVIACGFIFSLGADELPLSGFEVKGVYEHLELNFIYPEDIMNSLSGKLFGVCGSYEYCQDDFFYAKAQVVSKRGRVEGADRPRDIFCINGETRVGCSFAYGAPGSMLNIFSGLGYQQSAQKLEPMDLTYQEFYVPIGCSLRHVLHPLVSCRLTGVWMPQVYSSVMMVPIYGARWILNTIKKNYLFDFSWAFSLLENGRAGITLAIFYGHWENGHTNAVTLSGNVFKLPDNVYNFYGVNAGFFINF